MFCLLFIAGKGENIVARIRKDRKNLETIYLCWYPSGLLKNEIQGKLGNVHIQRCIIARYQQLTTDMVEMLEIKEWGACPSV